MLPGATVKVDGLEAATRAAVIDPVTASDQGVAGLVVPGRYVVQAAFRGSPPTSPATCASGRATTADDRPGHRKVDRQDHRRCDKQEAAADARHVRSALTREQIDALSDNPEEMRRQLADMAGPGSVIRVDSFEGGDLPPKSQIKSIHVTRDGFAAENHNAGAIFIDIITQPGIGPLRGGGNFSLRDGALSGQSPFVPVKGPERTENFGFNLGGSIVPQKSSFSVSVNGMTSYETPNLNVSLPSGVQSQAANIQTPRDRVNLSINFDDAITRDQTLRMAFFSNRNTARNLGIGAYDLPERGYATEDTSNTFRIQEAGPLGRRFFVNTRLNISRAHSEQHAAVEKGTIRVIDSFTSGGAQVEGGRDSTNVNIGSDLDYVRGIHSVRVGTTIDVAQVRSTVNTNYLGTYTFESVPAFEAAGRAASRAAPATRSSITPTCRAASTCRTTYASAWAHAQPRRALRDPDPRRRAGTLAAVRRDLGAFQERRTTLRRARACSTTGST